jgi:hypothetical protein
LREYSGGTLFDPKTTVNQECCGTKYPLRLDVGWEARCIGEEDEGAGTIAIPVTNAPFIGSHLV